MIHYSPRIRTSPAPDVRYLHGRVIQHEPAGGTAAPVNSSRSAVEDRVEQVRQPRFDFKRAPDADPGRVVADRPEQADHHEQDAHREPEARQPAAVSASGRNIPSTPRARISFSDWPRIVQCAPKYGRRGPCPALSGGQRSLRGLFDAPAKQPGGSRYEETLHSTATPTNPRKPSRVVRMHSVLSRVIRSSHLIRPQIPERQPRTPATTSANAPIPPVITKPRLPQRSGQPTPHRLPANTPNTASIEIGDENTLRRQPRSHPLEHSKLIANIVQSMHASNKIENPGRLPCSDRSRLQRHPFSRRPREVTHKIHPCDLHSRQHFSSLEQRPPTPTAQIQPAKRLLTAEQLDDVNPQHSRVPVPATQPALAVHRPVRHDRRTLQHLILDQSPHNQILPCR
jgi:hypothetical protein